MIFISTLLLGIWAVKDTIALRNISLVLGSLLSILYCYRFFKWNTIKIPRKNWVPLILLGSMFCWVIFHYLFLSRYPDLQLGELKSTWMRSFLAVILGVGTGIAILKRPAAVSFLWLGIAASFACVLYQYIPKALGAHSLFSPDYEHYIFFGKIYAVLMGTILTAALLGNFVDAIRLGEARLIRTRGLYWLVGTVTVLYLYVFAFDARNGIASVIFLFLVLGLMVLSEIVVSLKNKMMNKSSLGMLLLILFSLGLVFWFGAQQAKYNPGWAQMIDDTKIALQIDEYPNWQNPQAMGYPTNSKGQVVRLNTYERVAWAKAGATIFLPENPLGVGVLMHPFNHLLIEKYSNIGQVLSTHSAWLDMGLSFGFPGLLLMFGSLACIAYLSFRSSGPFRGLISLLSTSLLMIYTVGEVSNQHSTEILFFLIALLAALLFPIKPNPLEQKA
ncbi:MAG: O-antigen ligase family protein [Polynucleobacter sp.]